MIMRYNGLFATLSADSKLRLISQGQFFPYFILTMLGLVLVPLSFSTFAPSKRAPPTYTIPTFPLTIEFVFQNRMPTRLHW